LSEPRRRASLSLLEQTDAASPLAVQVGALLTDVSGLPDPDPGRLERWGRGVREWYLGLTRRRWFMRAVVWWFAVVGSLQLVTALVLALDHHGIRGFAEWATVVSSGVSGALIVIGVFRLRHHHLEAYRWFERGMLVQIFVTQVFEFAQEQLAGVFGLAFNILLWVAIRSMIRAEVERAAVAS